MNNTNGTGAGNGNGGTGNSTLSPCVAIYCCQGSLNGTCGGCCGHSCPIVPPPDLPPGGGNNNTNPLCAAPNNTLANGSKYEFWQNAFVKDCSNKFYLGSPSGNFNKSKFNNSYHGINNPISSSSFS